MAICAQPVQQGHQDYQIPLSCTPQRVVPNISFPFLLQLEPYYHISTEHRNIFVLAIFCD